MKDHSELSAQSFDSVITGAKVVQQSRLLSALMTGALLALSLARRFKRGFALRRKLILVRIEAGPDPAVTMGFRRAKLIDVGLAGGEPVALFVREGGRAQRCGDEKRRRGNLECCLHHGLLN